MQRRTWNCGADCQSWVDRCCSGGITIGGRFDSGKSKERLELAEGRICTEQVKAQVGFSGAGLRWV